VRLVAKSAEWSFSQTWVWLGLILFGAAFVVGAGFQSVALIRAERAVERANHVEASRYLRRWSVGLVLIILILLVTAWDMVFKPGL
jgi:uncharacterized membrane protein